MLKIYKTYSDETLSALLHDIANEDIGVKILFSDL